MTIWLRSILIAILATFWLTVDLSWADGPTPRIKPAPPKLSSILGDTDAQKFRSAMRAIDRRRWETVEDYRRKINDPTAKDILVWIQSMKDPEVSFEDLSYVVHDLSDWPRMTGIQAKAEDLMFDKPRNANDTIAWFSGRDPVSGEGRAALADAYFAIGDNVSGDYWLRKAWREAKLTRDGQKKIYKKHKSRLTVDDHMARGDHLIWEGTAHFSKVEGLLSLLPSAQKNLLDARMRTLRNRSGMDAAINRVPAVLADDTGLLYARAKWRRQKKTKEYALPVYLQISVPAATDKGKERVWRERKIMAYWAIKEERFQDAYNLTLHHGMARGSGFAEAEFLGGWLALRKLKQPDLAIPHFQRLRDGVSYPVSIARGSYWLGRAYEAKYDPQYIAHYTDAARFSNTYYGFLAADRLNPEYSEVILPAEQILPVETSSLATDRRFRAMELLAEAREEHYYTLFSFHMDDVVPNLENLTQLSQLGKRYGYMKPSVRAAKQASRFQDMLTESGYPIPEQILNLPDKFDKPFVLAIARQESEFNLSAVSSARAYGMMQMINSTASATARKHRISYSRSRLTTDAEYSVNLGALHLHDLLRQFDGSYILAAAAYNAGPHRAKQWIRDYGDPRTGEIDPIDWIESVPFSETRNYIHRVMENIQVYRARLDNNSAQNKILRDIKKGAF
ncbi:MAG: lytic transglycosylase domain-containing protein [Hellea sp.]|nr:lytic transglycosylase domain-containing protein [Hellea sp.]